MPADRNLLFGVLALQAGAITPSQFVEGCTLWANKKNEPLADLLLEKGWLGRANRENVDRLMESKAPKGSPSVFDFEGAEDAPSSETKPDFESGGQVLLSTVSCKPKKGQRYTLTRLHAEGGTGRVWLARDSPLGREVALKELQPGESGDPDVWNRFLIEAKITGQLEHPGIVPVYELAQRTEDKQPFYTMRFLRGRTLTDTVRTYHRKRTAGDAGSLDLQELFRAFVSVCNAVAYAHSRGVIHRDLKGQNVVLGNFGEVIVLDWGLAKVMGEPTNSDARTPNASMGRKQDSVNTGWSQAHTVHGQVMGTPSYISPEQAEGRLEEIDQRSDVYGLGAILYEILSDRPPFTGEKIHDVLRQVIEEEPIRPRQHVDTTPPALEAICLKALAEKPADRYPAAETLAQDVPALVSRRAGVGVPGLLERSNRPLAETTSNERHGRGGGRGGDRLFGVGSLTSDQRQSASASRPGLGGADPKASKPTPGRAAQREIQNEAARASWAQGMRNVLPFFSEH